MNDFVERSLKNNVVRGCLLQAAKDLDACNDRDSMDDLILKKTVTLVATLLLVRRKEEPLDTFVERTLDMMGSSFKVLDLLIRMGYPNDKEQKTH